MRAFLNRFVLISIVLGFVGPAYAQSNIEELIEQTGIEEGKVALRDIPGWREPRKIVIQDIALPRQEIEALLPGVEVIEAGSESEAIANARGADAIIGWCSNGVVEAAKDAIWVQIRSAGVERCMSTNRIKDGSVVLTNMQKMSSPAIAEHAMALSLSLARKIPQFAKRMETGEWHRRSPVSRGMKSVVGKTMLVIGLGGIGTEVARRAAALDMRVLGTRRSSREGPEFVHYVGLPDELLDLAAKADFVVNALPLTPETAGLIDEEFFNAVKRGAFFVNVGRGRTVVTEDLVAALENGRLSGAGLDVTDPEPLPADHPLWQMANVIVTPHVAARDSNRERHAMLLKENLRRFAAGDALLNVVDPELGY